MEEQPTAANFHAAYLAHLDVAKVVAAAGLHADALYALRFAVECFFKCVYQCAIDVAFGRALGSDTALKPAHKPAGPEDFVHDLDALVRMLDHLTDLRSISSAYRELTALLTELPGVDARYRVRQHLAAQPRYEKVMRSFGKLLDTVGHLR